MTEPKVSIIVPVYNSADYLRRCLNSLINQSLEEIEILIFDDCSTDNSVEIIEEYL
ncbi:MAG: glycosyltransferase family 2 protein, partial [Bacteroidetes bacterium]|nr:glycosyltransferase family 2 protein [Bacteroidota bacterium]